MLEMDAIVAAHDLNQHPFYRMWREGTLPRQTLGRYAAEYGRFIATLADGWSAIGYGEHAQQERVHAMMWNGFRDALGVTEQNACPEVTALVEGTMKLFSSRASAIGALYAFEAQQPSTARSKLDGLREHYDLGRAGEAYFALHADDYGEKEMLSREAMRLGAEERSEAIAACEKTCRAMWRALDGVLGARTTCN